MFEGDFADTYVDGGLSDSVKPVQTRRAGTQIRLSGILFYVSLWALFLNQAQLFPSIS